MMQTGLVFQSVTASLFHHVKICLWIEMIDNSTYKKTKKNKKQKQTKPKTNKQTPPSQNNICDKAKHKKAKKWT